MSGSQTLFLGAPGSPALPPATNKAVLLLMFLLFWEVGIVEGMGRGVTFYFCDTARHLSSPARDQTHVPCIRSAVS